MSARIMVASGPAMKCEKSTTRMPSSAWGAGGPSLVLRKVGFEVLQHVLAACLHRRTAHGVYPKPLPSSAFM